MEMTPPAAVVSRLPDMSANRCLIASSTRIARCGSKKSLDDHRLRAGLGHSRQSTLELIGTADQYRLELEAGSCGGPTGGFPQGSAQPVCGRGSCGDRGPGKVRDAGAGEPPTFVAKLRL